jgi:hypothetical protein
VKKLLSRAQRRERVLQETAQMLDQLEAWYDQHAEASFGEIEQEARRLRLALMGRVLEVVINGRGAGLQATVPVCPQCGGTMEFHEYRSRTIRGLEGETELQRAYYVCSQGCGGTFFPPGSTPEAANGPLERGGGASDE